MVRSCNCSVVSLLPAGKSIIIQKLSIILSEGDLLLLPINYSLVTPLALICFVCAPPVSAFADASESCTWWEGNTASRLG